MKFFVNTKSGVPIYKQIMQQIERGVAGGAIKPGERLPTVREVALDLTVNPNTVARAYRELETRGIITSVQGRGTFISDEYVPAINNREKIIRDLFIQVIQEARQLGFSCEDVKRLFEEIMNNVKGGLK